MEVVIRGTPKEIAALVFAVQERQSQQSKKNIMRFDGNINGLSQILRKAKDDTRPEAQEKLSS